MTDIAAVDLRSDDASRRDILGVEVCNLTRDEALAMLCDDMAAGRHRRVLFLNAHNANIAVENAQFRSIIERFTVLADGIGLDIASKLLYGQMFAANLNGTDFVPALLRACETPIKVGLYGAKPGVAERARSIFSAINEKLDIQVLADGYVDADGQKQVLDDLRAFKPDLLLVAMGVPRQEEWIAENITADHATVVMGVGALFDFLSGEVPRAPRWLRAIRMEWLFRLALEPGRLWRRYLLGNPIFLARVLRQRFGHRPYRTGGG